MIIMTSVIRGMHWPKTGATTNNAQLGLSDKGSS